MTSPLTVELEHERSKWTVHDDLGLAMPVAARPGRHEADCAIGDVEVRERKSFTPVLVYGADGGV